uniref:Uncharacterized protein LOC114327856 n=1 Tax=Diabrotica virgifera virgifera TaxID=50390 RepID=A0A6P7FGR6_DIAVI
MKKILIVTDSISSLHVIRKIYTQHPIALLIKEELHNLHTEDLGIKFLWVPSHVGVAGNEAADRNAKEAINDNSIPMSLQSVSMDLKSYFIKHLFENWNSKWKSTSSKLQEIKNNVGPWQPPEVSRRKQTIISRLRFGHTQSHEHLLKKEEPPICDECGSPLTVKHVLVEKCEKFNSHRIKYHLANNLKDILDYNNTNKLFLFLKDCNLLNKV